MVQRVRKLLSSLPRDLGLVAMVYKNYGMDSCSEILLWLQNTKDFPLSEEDLKTQFNGESENVLGRYHCLLT